MSHLFISDLHLEEGRPDITDLFLGFLETRASHSDSLYILGDFFEVWLGDDHVTPFANEIISALQALPRPKFIMHGNRDFLIGESFCRAIGATLLPDPSIVLLDDEPVLLMHGDSLCTRDTQYMAARKMLRDPAFQQEFLSKSIAERQAFAKSARQQSLEHTSQTANDIMDVTQDEVIKAMEAANVKTLIHGHTHRPKVHQVQVIGKAGQRIVLGDWGSKGWCLEAGNGSYRLESFQASP